MCIAIANLKGKALSQQQLENCWTNNKDGAGILYIEKGLMKVYKNITSLAKFIKKYNKVIQKSNCLLHFRISTAGGVNVKNCHPFQVNNKLGFIHNGVIHGWSQTKGQSDTYSYNEKILKALPSNFLDYPAMKHLIQEDIGSSNKFVFMDKDGKFTIINEEKGHFGLEGNWYSNDSYKRENDYYWAGNTKVWKPGKEPKKPTYSTYPRTSTYYYPNKTWDEKVAEGKIVQHKDLLWYTQDGRNCTKGYVQTQWKTHVWNTFYGCYVEKVAKLEEKISDTDLVLLSKDIEDQLSEFYDDIPDDDLVQKDHDWLQNELLSMPTYEDELCSIFNQLSVESFEQIRIWDDVVKLGSLKVDYVDSKLDTLVPMTVQVAINIICKKYAKTQKTLADTVQDYVTFIEENN